MRTSVWLLALTLVLVAASGWANVYCPDPENHLTNCGFDTDFADWTVTLGVPSHQPGDDSDGMPGSGSIELFWSGDQIGFFQCVDTALTGSIMFGIDAKMVDGNPPPACWVWGMAFDGANCLGSPTNLGGDIPVNTSWSNATFTESVPGGTQSLRFFVGCVSFAPYTMRFDDAFLVPFDDPRGIPATGVLGAATLFALVSLAGVRILRRRAAR